ncbi:MAG: bifunctional phosphoribosylaminoimidazolecarboxamide formyltransferase/IMP cyclohydrolase, partial [Candidatus Micrarchaeota archaeon]|nr:bifunctional phosphoribosylaminoimidazolecarboxamide formyltransferase/IMP cyclohydrolase [Candidatus Micrarchaeota archaeon]
MPIKPKRALISVYDKTGIVEFAKELERVGIEIISSGGTAKLLANSGVNVKEVSEITGFPEMMDGRVKTLHPKIHGGILADRKKKTHLEEAKKNNIALIDLVVVNLYPFEDALLKNAKHDEMIENIDIGGPALLRSAAKNYENVAVIVNPQKYSEVLSELLNGEIRNEMLEQLALEAFEHVAHYDVVIANYFRNTFKKGQFPDYANLSFKKLQDLRYGENPHQKAALYMDHHFNGPSILTAKQLQGKQLS